MAKLHTVPAADLELLRKWDTPTICNVVELFDLRPRSAGYMDARIQACYPTLPPMVGYAVTAAGYWLISRQPSEPEEPGTSSPSSAAQASSS